MKALLGAFNQEKVLAVIVKTDGLFAALFKGIPYMETYHKIDTPYADVDPKDFENDDDYKFELRRRWHCGWNNQFAFPWEISSYWNFTTR